MLFLGKITAEGTLIEAVSFLAADVAEKFGYFLCGYEDPLFFQLGGIVLDEFIKF